MTHISYHLSTNKSSREGWFLVGLDQYDERLISLFPDLMSDV